MPAQETLLLGEFRRTIDQRFRLSVPVELADVLQQQGTDLILAKERPGCLSLWNANPWQQHLQQGIHWVEDKLKAGKLQQQTNRLLQLRKEKREWRYKRNGDKTLQEFNK